MLILAAPLQAANPPRYTITAVAEPPNIQKSTATDLNNRGDVVGWVRDANGVDQGFLWRPETGFQFMPVPEGFLRVELDGINDAGTIVGIGTLPGQLGAGLKWTNYFDAQPIHPSIGMYPYGGINNRGEIAVQLASPTGADAYVLSPDNQLHPIGSLPATNYTWPSRINDAGYVVGYSQVQRNQWDGNYGFVWTPQGGIQDVGALTGRQITQAFDVNSLGQIIANGGSPTRGTFWSPDSGAVGLSIIPMCINDSGLIAGQTTGGVALRYPDGSIYNLNDLLLPSDASWQLIGPSDINQNGQIVGWGYHNGDWRAFLASPVPEPGLVLLPCLALFAGMRRRRYPL